MWMEVFGTRLATNVRILLQRPSAAALDSQHRDSLRTHFLVSLQLAAASLSSGISFCSFKDLVLRWFLSFAALRVFISAADIPVLIHRHLLQASGPLLCILLLFFGLYFLLSLRFFACFIFILDPHRECSYRSAKYQRISKISLIDLFSLKSRILKVATSRNISKATRMICDLQVLTPCFFIQFDKKFLRAHRVFVINDIFFAPSHCSLIFHVV